MPLGGKLSSSQKKKARKTPVHGAANKIKNALKVGGSKKKSKPKKRVDTRAQVKKNKAAYKSDVAKAKAAGWRKVGNTWIKTDPNAGSSYAHGGTSYSTAKGAKKNAKKVIKRSKAAMSKSTNKRKNKKRRG